MPERQQPERDPDLTPEAGAADVPAIETPVIDIQDLEHKPGPATRINNTGVKVLPQIDVPRRSDGGDIASEDEQARDAVAELERHLKTLPPD